MLDDVDVMPLTMMGFPATLSPNPQPLLNRPLVTLPINIHILIILTLLLLSHRRLVIHSHLLSISTSKILLIRLLQPMSNPILPSLLSIIHPSATLLSRLDRIVLHMHPEHRNSLPNRINRMRQQRRPRRQQMSERRRVLEVRSECESSQGGQYTLHISHISLANPTQSYIILQSNTKQGRRDISPSRSKYESTDSSRTCA